MHRDTEPFDKLAAEPSTDESRDQAENGEGSGRHRRPLRSVGTQVPAYEKHSDGEHIDEAMRDADRFCARRRRDRYPIDQSERRGYKAPYNARYDHPIRYGREQGVAPAQIDHIKNDRRGQEAQRKHDEYRMNRVPEKFCFAFHDSPPYAVPMSMPRSSAMPRI